MATGFHKDSWILALEIQCELTLEEFSSLMSPYINAMATVLAERISLVITATLKANLAKIQDA